MKNNKNLPEKETQIEKEYEDDERNSILSSKCYMSGCKNNRLCREKKTKIHMFLFPSNKNLAKFWLGICNHQPYECPYHGQTVCKDHFREVDLENDSDNSVLRLKLNVIPTANIPNICHSMLREFMKQLASGKELVPKEIGVDFRCHKSNCQHCVFSVRNRGCTQPGTSKDQNEQDVPANDVTLTVKRKLPTEPDNASQPSKVTIVTSNQTKKSPHCDKVPSKILCKKSCESTIPERKVISLPNEIQVRLTQVIKHITQIIQDFMAFQIHVTHIEQAVICATEKISNSIVDTKGDVNPNYYKMYQSLNNYLLQLYEIHGTRSADIISYCTKMWRRAIDAHQEIKIKGKFKVFITAANGCLVTIVRVIDSFNLLKQLWQNCYLKICRKDVIEDADWKSFNKLLDEHFDDATSKLNSVNSEIHVTRQKILDIKKPSIRIMEIAQLDVDPENIYITGNVDENTKHTRNNLSNSQENSVSKKTVTGELGEIVNPPPLIVHSPNVANEPITSPPLMQIPLTTTQSLASPVSMHQPLTTTQSIASPVSMHHPLTTTQSITSQMSMISAQPTITSPFPNPTLSIPTVPTFSMQPQLIPTLQTDAFGNQSIVYQLTYQPVSQNIAHTPPGIVIPGLTASNFNTTATLSPTMINNTSQEITQAPHNSFVSNNFNHNNDNNNTNIQHNEEITEVKPIPEKIDDVQIKEEPPIDIESNLNVTIKQEPE
uniref:CSON000960 protein n=1 Tax=Culicoides sonorensis TaxID=179676 RepID=A0A336K4J3_CULSO